MDKEYLLKIQRLAKNVATKSGHGRIADDFAQQVIIDLIQGRPDNMEWLLTDFLRKEYGDTRSVGGSKKSADRLRRGSSDQSSAGESDVCFIERFRSPDPEPRAFGADWRNKVAFIGTQAIVSRLIFDENMTTKDVGIIFGVSQSRISQHLFSIKKRMKDGCILTEVGDRYFSDKEYSKLEINWIRL